MDIDEISGSSEEFEYYDEEIGEEIGEETVEYSVKKPRRKRKVISTKDIVQGLLDDLLPNPLTYEDIHAGLCQLGKTANGLEHAFLMLKVPNKKLTDIKLATECKNIMYINVSGNRLNEKSLSILCNVEFLVMLNANENNIKTCELPPLPYLQVLSLSRNKISSTRGIDQPILECLDLSYNLIKEVTELDPFCLSHLKVLDIHGNSLTSTAGISCPTLEKLYLAENFIDRLEGLEGLVNLQVIHLRYNPLKDLSGFSENMKSLTYINLRNTKVRRLKQIQKLAILPNLDTLVIAETPLVRRSEEEYRYKVLSYIPKLKRIDKIPVQDEEIESAETIRKDREEAEEEEIEEESEEEEEEEYDSEI